MTVAALFVQDPGVYPTLLGHELCWDETRDARAYAGPYPVVAHPPCNLWVNMAAVNWRRYWRQRPAWYMGGTDEGKFAAALRAVRAYGGVLEHPAGSHAWEHYDLTRPWTQTSVSHTKAQGAHGAGWSECLCERIPRWRYYVCEVWQSAYGSRMRKRTWLLYVGKRPPFELRWGRTPGTHQVGWFDRNKPTVGKREASATPEAFAEELIRLAEWSRG